VTIACDNQEPHATDVDGALDVAGGRRSGYRPAPGKSLP
jgi:hypothetical protein